MSGELTLSQFKNTTTQNNDFVIGNPIPAGTTTDIADRYLVFQISDQIGPTHNPHIKAEKNIDGNWQIKLSDNGITDNNFAFLNSGTLSIPQLFVGINTFQGDVNFTGNVTTKNITLGASSSDTITFLGSPVFTGPLTFNSAITFTNDVTINAPSKTVLITASSINIANKLITLNKGLDISAGGIGILTGDATSGTTPGYIKTNSDNTAWIVKAPISVGTITIQPSTTATDMLIRPAGGVFAANKILEVLPPFSNTTGIGYLGTYQFAPAGDRVILSTIAGFTESNTPSSKLAFLNNVTSDIQTQLGANNSVIYTLTSRVDNAESSLIVTNQTMATLSSTTANSIIALDSRMTNTEATVTTTLSTFASEISANSLATTTLSSQVNNATTGLPATYASLTTEMTTRATADTAEANARLALAATIPGIANAAATSAMTTYASYGIASATSVTDLTATVGINAATAHNELLAYVGPLGTTTSSITSLSTTVGSNTAAISSNTTSINGLEAKWGISIDNNGHISGISLNSGIGGISTFSVLANKFEFVDPTNGTTTITPFSYSSGILHLDGSVVFSGGQILNALTSDLGYPGTTTINGASITTGTVTASNLVSYPIQTGGTNTTPPAGFKISSTPFNSTLIGGITPVSVQAEFGANVNIGGYLVGHITDKVFAASATAYYNLLGSTTQYPYAALNTPITFIEILRSGISVTQSNGFQAQAAGIYTLDLSFQQHGSNTVASYINVYAAVKRASNPSIGFNEVIYHDFNFFANGKSEAHVSGTVVVELQTGDTIGLFYDAPGMSYINAWVTMSYTGIRAPSDVITITNASTSLALLGGVSPELSLAASNASGVVTWSLDSGTTVGVAIVTNSILQVPNSVGIYTCNLRVIDSLGATATKSITITITSSVSLAVSNLSTTYSVINAYDVPADVPLYLTAVGAVSTPVWTVVSCNAPNGYTLTGNTLTFLSIDPSAGSILVTSVVHCTADGNTSSNVTLYTTCRLAIIKPPVLCFAAGTLVLMNTGIGKSIETIQRGDIIKTISADAHVSGRKDVISSTVLERIDGQGYINNMLSVQGILSTSLHPFAVFDDVMNTFYPAKSLSQVLKHRALTSKFKVTEIIAEVPIPSGTLDEVYTLTTDSGSYCVSASPQGPWLLVHNMSVY